MNAEDIKTKLSFGISPLNILNGYLKELIYDTQCLQDEASDGDQYNCDYFEGRIDALGVIYQLTEQLEREGK